MFRRMRPVRSRLRRILLQRAHEIGRQLSEMAVICWGGLVPIGALLRVATLQMSPQSLRRPQVFEPR